MTAPLKFCSDFRPNSRAWIPTNWLPRKTLAIWEENWHRWPSSWAHLSVEVELLSAGVGWLALAEYITVPLVQCCAPTTLLYATRLTIGNGVVWQVVNHINCAIFLFTQINIKMLLFSTKNCYRYLNPCCFKTNILLLVSELSILLLRKLIVFSRLVGNLQNIEKLRQIPE